jgi:hypothetical protein
MRKQAIPAAALAIAAALSVSACDVDARAVGGAALRTLASKLGASMFEDKGHPVDGQLACRTSRTTKKYTVLCTGRDSSGKPLALRVASRSRSGVSTDDSSVKGTRIVGKVGDAVLFRRTCMGSGC